MIGIGGVRVIYKCPDCETKYRTDLKSFFIAILGLFPLLYGAILLHLETEIPVYQNNKVIGLITTGIVIVSLGIKLIKLEPTNDT